MGYDVSNYCAIDSIYGTMEDVDALAAGLHARGMKFVMDLVVNHTSDQVIPYRLLVHPKLIHKFSMIGSASPDLHETIQNVTGTSGETHASTVKDGASRRITGHRYLEVGSFGRTAATSDSGRTSADSGGFRKRMVV
jgi:hypothetical protein